MNILISARTAVDFNKLLSDAIKQGWSPFGNLCANVSLAKSEYSTGTDHLFAILLIRKSQEN